MTDHSGIIYDETVSDHGSELATVASSFGWSTNAGAASRRFMNLLGSPNWTWPGTDSALLLGWLNVIIEEQLYDKEFVEKWTIGFDELAKEYPLIYFTGLREKYWFHSFGLGRSVESLRRREPDPILEIHPDTVHDLSLLDGDWAWVETSTQKKIKLKVGVSADAHPSVVRVPHGWWFPEKEAENASTATTNTTSPPRAVNCGMRRSW